MAYKIMNEFDPVDVQGIVMVLYGDYGIGKTSLAFTAEGPFLEDYDEGVRRCVKKKRYLKIAKWEDAVDFHKSQDFENLGIKTLIIDTAGTMLDNYIAQYVIKADTKNARNGGEISLQGYGAMKSVFNQFVNMVKSKGIDLIFVCHTEAQKEGDNIKFIPKMTGGSSDIMMRISDMVGYYESRNNKRTLNFNPTDRNVGKNTAEFDLIQVPHYDAPEFENFLAGLIAKTKAKMTALSNAQLEVLKAVEAWRGKIEAAGISELEAMLPEIEKENQTVQISVLGLADKRYTSLLSDEIAVIAHPNEADQFYLGANNYPERYKTLFKHLLWNHCKKLGFTFEKETGKFIKPDQPTEQPADQPAAQTEAPAPAPAEIPGAGKKRVSKTKKTASNATENQPVEA